MNAKFIQRFTTRYVHSAHIYDATCCLYASNIVLSHKVIYFCTSGFPVIRQYSFKITLK